MDIGQLADQLELSTDAWTTWRQIINCQLIHGQIQTNNKVSAETAFK